MVAALPLAARASDPGAGPNAHHGASRIIAAELAMQDATDRLKGLTGEHPSGLAETMRHELAVAGAMYSYRQAVRQEELRVYELAGYASVETSVVPLLPSAVQSPLHDSIAALHSLYILAGIDQYYLVNVHFNHPYMDAAPLASLRSYYIEAQIRYGAPYDMRTAIWHYNLDYNYVDSVELFARAYRADPAWLDRMYYWNTFG